MLTTPKKPDYGFAYFIVYLMYFISVVIFFIGLKLAAPAINNSQNIFLNTFSLYSAIFGGSLILSSVVILAAAQITKAVLDTSIFSWHTMIFTKKINSTAKNQDLNNDSGQ